jgi:hypothetical protein
MWSSKEYLTPERDELRFLPDPNLFVKLTVAWSLGIDARIRSDDLTETGLVHPHYLIQGFVYDTHDKPLFTTIVRI